MVDEEKVITVENEGGKGNPNHAPAGAPDGTGGQFVSGPESGGGDTKPVLKDGDDLGTLELKKAPPSSVGNAFLEFMGKKREKLTQEANEFISGIESGVGEKEKEFYSSLSRDQKLDLLYNSPNGYDKNKLKFATDAQLTALLYAEAIKNKNVQIEQQIEIWKQRRQEIENEINEKLKQNNIDGFSGIWAYDTKYPSDWKQLSESGSIDAKREYYNSVLNSDQFSVSDRFKAKMFLKKLDEFEKLGQEYENLKSELQEIHLDDLEEIELKTSELLEESQKYQEGSDLRKTAQSYLDKFIDVNATYSKERKNKATWFKSFHPAYNHFVGRASEHWQSMSSVERNVIQAYTGSGYSRFNKPLRGIAHDKYGYSFDEHGLNTFSEGVNNLTKAIDKCTWDEDIWVNRYIANGTRMFKLPGSSAKRTLESMSEAELKMLENTSFTDGGFFSAGAAKGTGYHTGNIVFNVYCPKGTKMAYVAPYSTASKGENEMILQRGYEYRITKVERKGNSFFLDMEVILGSDSNKPVGNDLKKIGNEYYYKPRGEKGEDYD